MGGAVSVSKDKKDTVNEVANSKQGPSASSSVGTAHEQVVTNNAGADNTSPTVLENQSSIIDQENVNQSSLQSSPRGINTGLMGSGFFRSPYLYSGGSRSASNSSQGNSSPNRVPVAASPSGQSGSSGSPMDSPYHQHYHYSHPGGARHTFEADDEDEEASPPRINGDEADMFLQTALSLGMDNEDLLFNMMFFDEGHAATFGAMLNTMQTETLALHSENNTPYKLNPANDKAKSSLMEETYCTEVHAKAREGYGEDDHRECAVCKDEMDDGCIILRIPTCRHFFHQECLLRWVTLQAWCPVCRSALDAHTTSLDSVSEVANEQGALSDPTQLDLNTFTPRTKMPISRKLEFEDDHYTQPSISSGYDDIADQKMLNRKQQQLQLQADADEKCSSRQDCDRADDKGYYAPSSNNSTTTKTYQNACHDSAEKIVQHALQSFCHKEIMSKD